MHILRLKISRSFNSPQCSIYFNFTPPKKKTGATRPGAAGVPGQSSEPVDKAKARVLKVLVRPKPQTMKRSEKR